ncbi:uncharacterized protein LOC109846115 [Asparagus officinalis]|uniref:uncharacterized protein LOC109846115 n=1 Tax=Asparagus officinalis TaxID=4686 RepID=UPI00098E1522|nr:uncharacterized protein LOC109846115 [Asparagus officinalis]
MDMKKRRKKKQRIFWLITACTTSAIATYYYKYIYKEPCMTSHQRGEDWMREILNGHPIRCVNAFRMESRVFLLLCEELQSKYGLTPSRNMTVVEKVGIFVYTIALGLSNRDVGERFQRSGETISRTITQVLEAICGRNKGYMGLARDVIQPKDRNFQFIPPQIANDTRYMPYFKDCIGCIDGTHVAACIPEADQLRYRGRKDIPTFNVMAVCDFDMCFTFLSVGWEGSAHDTRVFLHVINTPTMNFPHPLQGRYYLVDKGYPDRLGYLVPYPKIRYHQSQFQREAPTNAKETFNRAHSSLRSCIERSFGVLKKRWKILHQMPQYSVKTQIDIVMTAFALHNYIRINSVDDPLFKVLEQQPNYVPEDETQDELEDPDENSNSSRGTTSEMREVRDNIALLLWSLIAAYILVSNGYKNVFHLEGGLYSWFKEGLPAVGEDE